KHDGYFLYGRVSTFADCSNWQVSPAQRYLCFHLPPAQRPGPNFYVWHRWSVLPYRSHPFALDSQLRTFAVAAIEHDPVAYASTILGALAHYAPFGHWTSSFDTPFRHWRFPASLGHHRLLMERAVARHGGTLALDGSLARPLATYQRFVFLPGTVMAAM